MGRRALGLVLVGMLGGCPGEFNPDLGDLDLDFDGEQPERGLYSPCLSDADCVTEPPRADACMTVDGEKLTPAREGSRGFCTRVWEDGDDVDVHCAPHPGGDVTAELGLVDGRCVLDCGEGRSCPVGMGCHFVSPDGAHVCL